MKSVQLFPRYTRADGWKERFIHRLGRYANAPKISPPFPKLSVKKYNSHVWIMKIILPQRNYKEYEEYKKENISYGSYLKRTQDLNRTKVVCRLQSLNPCSCFYTTCLEIRQRVFESSCKQAEWGNGEIHSMCLNSRCSKRNVNFKYNLTGSTQRL